MRSTLRFLLYLLLPVWVNTSLTVVLAQETSTGPMQSRRVAELSFSTDMETDAEKLTQAIPPMIGKEVDPVAIRQAIENLYRLGEFHYVECRQTEKETGIALNFRLVAKRYFGRLSLEGPWETRELEEALMRSFPLGEAYDPVKAQRFLDAGEKILQEFGFFTRPIQNRVVFEESGRGADLTLTLPQQYPAILDKIEWQGDPVLPQAVIEKASRLRSGRPYRASQLKQGMRRLRALYLKEHYLSPTIELAYVRPNPRGNKVDIGIRLLAGPRVEVSVEGVKLSQRRIKELVPVFRESSLDRDVLNEGADNLQEYFLKKGYASARFNFQVRQDTEAGVTRVIYQTQLDIKQPVDKITIRGHRQVPLREMIRWLHNDGNGIREGDYFLRIGFEASQERLLSEYRLLGYQDVAIRTAELTASDDGHILVDLDIEEGERWQVGGISFQENRSISSEELSGQISWKGGDPFSVEKMETVRKQLQEYLLNKGYPVSHVEAEYQEKNRLVEIVFILEEGKKQQLGPLYYVGQEKTRLSALRRNVDLRSGQPLVLRHLFEGEQQLYNTGAFDLVHIRSVGAVDSEQPQPVVVGVREGRHRLLNFGFGVREYEGPRGLLEISHLNPRGQLITAQARLKASVINQSLTLSLRQPRPLNRNLESSAILEASRDEQTSFTENRIGGSLQMIRDLSRTNALIFRYNYERIGISDMPPSAVADACRVSREDDDSIPRESCPIQLSSVSASFYNDSRDDPFDPQRGAFASVNLQVTAPILKTDANFAKLFAQGQYYLSLPLRLTMSNGFRFGWAHRFGDPNLLPISERFFAGGSSTLRGFGNDQAGPRDKESDEPLGGNSMLINNLELLYPLFSRIRGAVFYDMGNVFQQSIRWREFSHSVGLGIRVRTPLGPLRLEYGINLDPPEGQSKGHFFLSFGPLF